MQYFQFDSSGNMFIFAPGSGFSGPAVKVEPGFELSEVQNVTQSLVHELSLTTDVDKSSTQIFDMSTCFKCYTSIDMDIIEPTPIKRY